MAPPLGRLADIGSPLSPDLKITGPNSHHDDRSPAGDVPRTRRGASLPRKSAGEARISSREARLSASCSDHRDRRHPLESQNPVVGSLFVTSASVEPAQLASARGRVSVPPLAGWCHRSGKDSLDVRYEQFAGPKAIGELSKHAAELLLDRIGGGVSRHRRVVVPPELARRQSCCAGALG